MGRYRPASVPTRHKPVVPDQVTSEICAEVVRRLREDKAEEWGFNSIFHEAAKAHNVFHGNDPARYNRIFRQAITKANGALGRPFVQRAEERRQQRPSGTIPENANTLTRRILGEKDDD